MINKRGLKTEGEPIFARYNPPFMPWFLRRNEVLYTCKAHALMLDVLIK